MTYEKLVEKIRKAFVVAEGWDVNEHKAIQLNIRGEGEGALYIELSNGKFNVQPYEYYDNNAEITISSKVLIDILEGAIEPAAAYDAYKFSIIGDAGLATAMLAMRKISASKKTAKKETKSTADGTKKAAKKATDSAKKTVKKTADETKKTVKKAEGEAAKPAKKAAVKKTTAKKTSEEKK